MPHLRDNIVEVHSSGSVSPVEEDEKKGVFTQVEIAAENILPDRSPGKTFAEDSRNEVYRPIESYEGYHRFDVDFEWTEKEEKRVVRKIDWRICSWCCLMFFALQLDRANISQALSDNMLNDLHMNTNQYNYGQTIFYCTFLLAELPSQLLSKKLGPDNWIPVQMIGWSIVASCQAFLKGPSTFYVTRMLLGLMEGGFIPDNVLYLSYFYTGTELPVRLMWFWVSYQSTNIVSAFLAYGLLHMRGINGVEGWRWLFALEGTLTGLIGIASWFYLPASPTQTASRFRGKNGWFTEHEEKIMVNRVLRDDPSKGDMHNRQGLSLSMFWECLKDYHMWPMYLLGLTWQIPTVPITAYLTLQMRAVGFDTFQTNLLTVPAYVMFIIGLLFWTWLSQRLNERFIITSLAEWWVLPCYIALVALPRSRNPWVVWVLCCLIYAMPYLHPVMVAITSRNAGSVRTRTVASALYNMMVQAANIIGANIYRNDDKPYYFRGNKVIIAIICYNIVLFYFTKVFYVRVNRKREAIWNAMTQEEKEHYLATTTDKGNKRLDFRFEH